VLRLLDSFEDTKNIYLVLEYLRGGDLFDYFEMKQFKLQPSAVRDLVCQISYGLNAIHKAGIIHRDLKPENVMLTYAPHSGVPTLKIVDFGLSQFACPNQKLHSMLGTIQYAAPELLQCKPYNLKTETWSLGIVFYFLAYGVLPVDDESDRETAKLIVKGTIEFPPNKGLS